MKRRGTSVLASLSGAGEAAALILFASRYYTQKLPYAMCYGGIHGNCQGQQRRHPRAGNHLIFSLHGAPALLGRSKCRTES